MNPIHQYLIVIGLLFLNPVVAPCCEKVSPTNASHFMNGDLIREAKAKGNREASRIEYILVGSNKNYNHENRGNTGKLDYLYIVNQPIESGVFLVVLVVLSGSIFIISGIMIYKIMHGNPTTNLND